VIPVTVTKFEIKGDDPALADIGHTNDGLTLNFVVVVSAAPAATAAATGLCLVKLGAAAADEEFDGLSGGLSVLYGVDGNADLLETLERVLAHSTGEEDLDALFLEQLDRSHASAIFVAAVRQNRDFADLTAGDLNKCEGSAVAEVFGNG